MRITIGALLIPHGGQKLWGWFGGSMDAAIAGFTRPVAMLVMGFMAVAVVQVHWSYGYFWFQSGFEYPLMWGLMALAVAIKGGGRYSLDARFGREV